MNSLKLAIKEVVKNNLCTTCSEKVSGFNDELSEKEYQISGMCQSCQDDVFNHDPDAEDGGFDFNYDNEEAF